jgi:hypothetical protein
VVASLIKSAGCQLVICVLEREAQKWARVTRNKTVRAVRPKADNIWQVGSGCYIVPSYSIVSKRGPHINNINKHQYNSYAAKKQGR